ncbi:MAG: hypothetical protein KAU38_07785 [Desulfobacterales bacterium]|nr:hypothetical protein [Desulfobacterales bacterium]
MALPLSAEVLQDDLAVSLARAVAAANKRAREIGVDVLQSLISITEQIIDGCSVWRVNYGPKDYVNQRGGDVLIEVDMHDGTVKRVLRGQ